MVFTAAAPRPPLNLGAPPRLSRAPRRTSVPAPVRGPSGLARADEREAFLTRLFAEAGLSARDYRPSALRRRLPACLRALRVEDMTEARRALRRNPQLVPVALDALLLGVTEFFRDPPVYACLERELPSLFLPTAGRLRVWSAGCSDGAELYSVAMLLAEFGAPDRCELLGTDCRPDAITRAAAGVFARHALRGLSADCLARFFEPVTYGRHADDAAAQRDTFPGRVRFGGPVIPRAARCTNNRSAEADPTCGPGPGEADRNVCPTVSQGARDASGALRVSRAIRVRIAWRRSDAVAAPEPGPWHVILCRNMGMYLEPAAAERLWRGLASVLSRGGLLVVGKAERPTGAAGLVPVGPCVYRRCGGPS